MLECGNKFPFLPGSYIEKISPYLYMIDNEINKWAAQDEIRKWESEQKIERCAIELMRGRNFENCYVLIDEIENASYQQIKMLLTRITESCKMIMMGDASQTDLKEEYPPISSVMDQLLYSKIEDLAIIEFGLNDIVRSDIVAQILKCLKNF